MGGGETMGGCDGAVTLRKLVLMLPGMLGLATSMGCRKHVVLPPNYARLHGIVMPWDCPI